MSSSFDDQLRRKLDKIIPEDVGLPFDREKVWERIHIVPPDRKVLPFKSWSWITHTAAITAGIFIGIWFFAKEKQAPPGTIAVGPATGEIPFANNNPISAKELPLTKTRPATATVSRSAAATNRLPSRTIQVANSEDDLIKPVEHQEDPEIINEAPVIAQANIKMHIHKQVLHLADIMNENDLIANTPEIRVKSVWARLIPEENNGPDGEPESFTMAVSNLLKNKRN